MNLTSFFISFPWEKGAYRPGEEFSRERIRSFLLQSMKSASLQCWATKLGRHKVSVLLWRHPAFVQKEAGLFQPLYFFLTNVHLPPLKICHASKRSCSDSSSHISISGHTRDMGYSSLSPKCFTGLRILTWLKFSLYIPASLLLQVRSQANICLQNILMIQRKLTCFAVMSTRIELSHKVSLHILFVLILV